MVLGLHEIVALAEEADVVDRRPAAQGDFEVVVELELMRRAAKLSVAHRPRAGSPIAIPDGTLDGSGDVAIVSAPLDGLLARPIGQPFAFAIALEEELEAHAHDPLEVAVWEFVRERGARLLHLAPGTRSRLRLCTGLGHGRSPSRAVRSSASSGHSTPARWAAACSSSGSRT